MFSLKREESKKDLRALLSLSSLESKVSLRNVEEYATQKLGMAPLDKSQITYINLNEGDRVELTSESPRQTIADRIQLAIQRRAIVEHHYHNRHPNRDNCRDLHCGCETPPGPYRWL